MMRSTTKILILATVCCVLVQLSLAQYGGGGGGSGFVSAGGSGGDGGGDGGGGGGGGAGGGDGKFFQYAHHPNHDEYEFGYHRGNEHHHRERHEKAQPHAGHFKTKVRWGDKKGGHGEHLWDYNHDGHDEGHHGGHAGGGGE